MPLYQGGPTPPAQERILINEEEDFNNSPSNNVEFSVVSSNQIVKETPEDKVAFTPEDLEPPRPTDKEFPKDEENIPLPALRFDSPLPKNVLPEKLQSRVLGWDSPTVKVVNRQTGIFSQLPMICAGTEGCPFGKWCPIPNRDEFIGSPCPLEQWEIFTKFSGYVRDLKADPKDFTDLMQIAELCRLHLIMWRTDMAMKMEKEIIEEVGVVDQKTGTPYYRKIVNQNRVLQEATSNKILKIYEKLVATRDAKKKNNKEGTGADSLAEVLSKISGHTTRAIK